MEISSLYGDRDRPLHGCEQVKPPSSPRRELGAMSRVAATYTRQLDRALALAHGGRGGAARRGRLWRCFGARRSSLIDVSFRSSSMVGTLETARKSARESVRRSVMPTRSSTRSPFHDAGGGNGATDAAAVVGLEEAKEPPPPRDGDGGITTTAVASSGGSTTVSIDAGEMRWRATTGAVFTTLAEVGERNSCFGSVPRSFRNRAGGRSSTLWKYTPRTAARRDGTRDYMMMR